MIFKYEIDGRKLFSVLGRVYKNSGEDQFVKEECSCIDNMYS